MFNFLRRRRPPAESTTESDVLSPPRESVDEDGVPRIDNVDVQRAQCLPPGQSKAKKWPVLHYSEVPKIDLATWDFRVFGCVDTPLHLTWDEMSALPRVRVHADMHCVTSWTVLDQEWEGVSVTALLERAGLRPQARFLLAHGADAVSGGEKYSTNMPLGYVMSPDVVLATACNGQPLTAEHGGPMRLVVPRLYAWKSAKWIRALELLETDRPGFWERNGYNDRGDPWTEERYR